MDKRTKIVATISSSRSSEEFLGKLIENGVNVFRLNTAHIATLEEASAIVARIRKVSDKVAILIDTKGPEMRTVGQGEEIQVNAGDSVNIIGDPAGETRPGTIYVSHSKVAEDVSIGDAILIDDGEIGLKVTGKKGNALVCSVDNGGVVKLRKGVNVPNEKLNLPVISERDRKFIIFAAENDIDFIAHSFVQSGSDIEEIHQLLAGYDTKVRIIAKIENGIGVQNLDSIISKADGVMVARGDLGIEIPLERIPAIQKRIVRECIKQKKPVIIATQMLHSMIENPRPTRAEVTDIATAVIERSDALMLSGETASGKYPVEAVQTMSKVIIELESEPDANYFSNIQYFDDSELSFLTHSAVIATKRLPIKAILVDTLTGRTARFLSAYRGKVPVYAGCYHDIVVRQLALSYGVIPFKMAKTDSRDQFLKNIVNYLLERKELTKQDLVLVVGGSFGPTKGVTFIELSKAEDIFSVRESSK